MDAGGLSAELAVIGCMVTDPELSGPILETVREEDFEDAALRSIFTAARGVFLSGRPTDPVLVLDAAGKAYEPRIREAIQNTPTTAFWYNYVHDLREAGALRRLNAAGLRVATAGTAADAREALAEAEGLVTDRPDLRIFGVGEAMEDFRKRMEDKRRPPYLPWPWPSLDKRLRAEPGDLIILGADSSVGKTALALQMAWTIAACGRRTGFFSLETSAKKLADRIAAQQASVSMERIKEHKLEGDEPIWAEQTARAAARIPLDLIEAAGYSVADVRSVTLSRRYEVIFCDYVQLLTAPGKDRWEIVTSVSMDLHRLAQELGVAVIGLSQITAVDRKAKKAPDKDSLRESRQLKQDADVIMMLRLDDPEDTSSFRWLDVAKNKDGPLSQICLAFDPRYLTFRPTDSRDWSIRRQAQEAQAGPFKNTKEKTPFEEDQEALPL